MSFKACLSFEGFEKELEEELRRAGASIQEQRERLFLVNELESDPVWAQIIWRDPRWIEFESLSQAAKLLKDVGPLWANYSFDLHRRSQLIQEKIHRFQPKKLQFLKPPPDRWFGAWTLWDSQKILAAPTTNSVLPLGEANFDESKEPPSRAYLKLWEVFTVHQLTIARGSHAVDLGSSPGGWTWVLSEMGCEVTSVDKAPLAPGLLKRANIHALKKDAFALDPATIQDPDIVFSDIICDPRRLYELVLRWMKEAKVQKFVCTLKFKGETDFEIVEKFLSIPDSRIIHLFHNKHEVTWIKGF